MASDQLTLFAEVFPAPIFQSRVKASASPDHKAAYGRSTPELLANYDPATSSWKMLRPCLFGEWDEFSGIFPPSGMTRSGELYRLQMLEPHTCADASGLWPTPTATEYGTNQSVSIGAAVRPSLGTMARRMWQTPVSDDAVERTGGKFNSRGEPKLSAEVKMWPSPRAIDGSKGARSPTEFVLKRAATGLSNLAERVQLYPTPTAQDASNNAGASQFERNSLPLNAVVGGSLNPQWVEWLMGYPPGWTALED